MSVLESPLSTLDPALEKQRVELAELIYRHTRKDGTSATGVDALFVSRYSESSDFAPSCRNRHCVSWLKAVKRCDWRTNSSLTTRLIT